MLITMHCGGMPFNGDTIKAKSLGGSETAAYYVAKELAARGHRVTLFTNENGEGFFDGVKYIWAGELSEESPLGEQFHFYASNTPCDVLLLQRQPGAFAHRFQSKLNICWLHDIALYRHRPLVATGLWNVDAFFTVSEWHKKQVCEVYGLDPGIVRTVTNGVDLNLFAGKINYKLPKVKDEIALIYSSRPERGLEHHVRPGGIMERLWEIDKRFRLYVCNYDNNTPQMAQYYAALYARIEELPNCTGLGNLTKQQLADAMRQCDALVYPTEFEEVSCITAMEAMAAGLPFISSEVAALPETCFASGTNLIPLKDGVANEDEFIAQTLTYLSNATTRENREATSLQIEAAKKFDWPIVAARFEQHFEELFAERAKNPETVLRSLIHDSDYYAAELFAKDDSTGLTGQDTAEEEMRVCYAFARDRNWKEHYERYYEYEKQRGIEYGPEDCTNTARYNVVAGYLSSLAPGSTVCDYGCAHGHYTINLAKQFPQLEFIGVDIAASNIELARKWAADEAIGNVHFHCGAVEEKEVRAPGGLALWADQPELKFDAVIVAEVLEHVEAPWDMVDTLSKYLKPKGRMITTTPFGPWEAMGYKEHWPWRAHVHHLEREDLHDLFGMHPGFRVTLAAGGFDKFGDGVGSYICAFGKPSLRSGRPDYARKFKTLAPAQTLSVCIIAKDSEHSLGRCLESIKDIADEIIIGIDETTKDATRDIARRYVKGFSPRGDLLFDIKSPLEQGFDEARNEVIAKAKGDWILWIDSDEVLFNPENVRKYLRENMFTAYAVRQLHYSVEPAGVMKTDLPSRFFRNGKGVKFFGVVHEHPEIELNKGIGHATVLPDVLLAHYGYSTEVVRRKRFERNIELLIRDRKKYPDRVLGKFLWLRDLAQMCRWEAEANGNQITPAMRARAKVGIAIWEELLDDGQMKMIADQENLNFYSTLVQVLGEGFDFGFKLDTSKLNGGAHPEKQPGYTGRFFSKEHAEKFFLKLLADRTTNYESKYF